MSTPEPLPRYPVFERAVKRDNTGIIIVLIIVVILIATMAIVIYAVFHNRPTKVVTRCEPGLCAITLATGIKRCPASNSEQLVYDQIFEDCTSRNYCQSQSAPCATLAGGILNCAGNCGTGNDQCNCAKAPT